MNLKQRLVPTKVGMDSRLRGNDRKRDWLSSHGGFTLFEVVITVAILSIGLVVIYEALFVCLNTFSYYLNCLTVQCWMNEKIWRVEDYLVRSEGVAIGDTAGEFVIGRKKIEWRMSIKPISEGELYQLSLICSWREGSREVNVSRAAYAGI
jgi:prepilin-type N-terminal cleavage/methylation domain-containing protein